MMLFNLIDIQLAFGMQPLLDRASLSMQEGERIGLVGRNGTGKSSLLQIISGNLALDDGEVQKMDGLRIAYVEQEPVLPLAESLRDSLIARGGLDDLHDDRDRWRVEARLVEFLHRFGLDVDMSMDKLSGGERKRAALALAFAQGPDILFFDEPTNHLDIAGIELLEETLLKAPAAIVVTHDRFFLDRIATRIVELDRGVLRSYPGNFSAYEQLKADQLAAEEMANRRFDKFWAQEEVWIRKGVEARRTRNEGRVKRLESLRRDRSERRDRIGNVKLSIDSGDRSGKLVAELEGVSKSFGTRPNEKPIVKDLSLRILRGDRFAFIGPNGAGKSTLIKLILGSLQPDSGTIRLGTQLAVAYFDQMREQLDPEKTVAETISPGSDWVEINGTRKHVMSYLADFLFPPRRVNSPVRMLSGGERNRLLLARLFARPANLLVLDEPTNDLDIESLELLEQTLQEYKGTLLLVSHDRAFLDNVATQTLVAEGEGKWREYVGGYSDWLNQRRTQDTAREDAGLASTATRERPRVKLSYKDQRELDALPAEIEALEKEQAALAARMSNPEYYKQDAGTMRIDQARTEELETLLENKLKRWAALEEKQSA